MLHSRGLAVNALFEASAFFLPTRLKVRGTFMTELFVKAKSTRGRSVRIEFTPNKMPFAPVVYDDTGKAHTLRAGEPPITADDVSASVSESGHNSQVLELRTAAWKVEATARMIARSVVLRKRQIDLWLVPLRDPLAPDPQTGTVVAPHGLIGQSFDGDNIAIDGKKDHYRELWWRQTSFKANEITTEAQAEGAIEGSGDDYKLDDVFGTDFKYARFNAAAAAPRNVSELSGQKRAAHGQARDAWQRARIGAAGVDGSEDPDRGSTSSIGVLRY